MWNCAVAVASAKGVGWLVSLSVWILLDLTMTTVVLQQQYDIAGHIEYIMMLRLRDRKQSNENKTKKAAHSLLVSFGTVYMNIVR